MMSEGAQCATYLIVGLHIKVTSSLFKEMDEIKLDFSSQIAILEDLLKTLQSLLNPKFVGSSSFYSNAERLRALNEVY